MQRMKWLRYGLASMTVLSAGLAAALVACSDDEETRVAARDAGGGDATPTPTEDGSTSKPPTPDAGTNAKLQLVNAATDLGPGTSGGLRICYGAGPDAAVVPLPPLPDRAAPGQPFPAVFIGTGGAVQSTGVDLSDLAITPYVLNAEKLAAKGIVKPDAGVGPTCKEILGGTSDAGSVVEGVDYWKLEPIPAKTFTREKSFVLVLTGCTASATSGIEKCGPGFSDAGVNGNLKVTVHELDRATAIDATKIGAQFIHASAQVGATTVVPGFLVGPDGGTFKGLTGEGDAATPVTYNMRTPLVQVSDVNVQTDKFTANPAVPTLAIPLPVIQLLSYGANVPAGGEYRNGAAFTFIALGDPAAANLPDGGFNTKRFHYIALPNDPAIEIYKP